MSVSPKLQTLIPAQSFETIAIRIGEILFAELKRQHVLSASNPDIQKVWVERFAGFDSPNDFPTVNVNFAKGAYANQTPVKADGQYTYNIDVYTNAQASGATQWADQKAASEMLKIMGMIRSILSYPGWCTLGFSPGLIGHVTISSIKVADRSTTVDALASTIGRIQLEVSARETNELENSVPLQSAATVIKIGSSDKGFFIEAITE